MTEEEFLKKYKNVKVTFFSLHNYVVQHSNRKVGIWCSGYINYMSYITNEIPVYMYKDQVDDFKFGFYKTADLVQE